MLTDYQSLPLPLTHDANLSLKKVAKLISRTGGVMILARTLSTGCQFVITMMLTNSLPEDPTAQTYLLKSGALIGPLRHLITGITAMWLHVSGDDMSKLTDKKAIGRIYNQTLLGSVIFTVPGSVVYLFGDKILLAMGVPSPEAMYAKRFFMHAIYGILPELISSNMQTLALSLNQPWHALATDSIASLTMLGLDYEFVYKRHMDYRGTGLATSIAFFLNCCVIFLYHKFNHKFKDFHLYQFNRDVLPSKEELKLFFKRGGIYALQFGINITAALIIPILIEMKPHNDLAAYQVGMQYLSLTMFPLMSASPTVGYLVSQNAQNIHDAKKIRNFVCAFSVSLMMLMLAVAFAIPKQLSNVFIKSNEAQSTQDCDWMLWLTLTYATLHILRLTYGAYLRGMTKDTSLAFLVNVANNLFTIGCGAALNFATPLGGKGFYVARIAAELVSSPVLIWQGNKKINQPDPNRLFNRPIRAPLLVAQADAQPSLSI